LAANVCQASLLSASRIFLPNSLRLWVKGFAFLAVEDPTGMVNIVIAPDIYAHDRVAL
jgi:hypothetical protein